MREKTKLLKMLPSKVRRLIKEIYNHLKGKRFSDLVEEDKKDIKKLLEKLYWDSNLSLRKIASLLERDYDTIYRWFLKLGVKKRSYREAAATRRIVEKLLQKSGIEIRKIFQKIISNENKRNTLLKRVPKDVSTTINKIHQEFEKRKLLSLTISSENIPKKILKYLYSKRKLSLREIGILFSMGAAKIQKRLEKYNIQRRSVSDALTKYPKKPFIENNRKMIELKCYLLGVRYGDLYVILDDRRVICSVSTTHPAWEKLMSDLFGKFGPIRKYPFENRKGRYAWRISAYLDKSFSFLINKLVKIPSWIANDKLLFFNFLAGLIDSDGTITPKDKKRICIRITTTDKWLVKEIKSIFELLGHHSVIYEKENHDKSHFGNKTIYDLEMSRKNEIMELLSEVPFKHEEKVKKSALVLRLKGELFTKAWGTFREEITVKSIKYQKLAEIALKGQKSFNDF